MRRITKWRSLGDRVASLKDGESMTFEREGNLAAEALKIRIGLKGIKACILVRRTARVIDGRIVITSAGT